MSDSVMLLLRHGAIDMPSKALHGRINAPLSPEGLGQAAALADRIRAEYMIGALITSPLRRTAQTADVIGQATAAVPRVHEAFIDIDYGRMTGKTPDSLSPEDAQVLEQWKRHPTTPLPGGESPHDVQARALRAIRDVVGAERQCTAIVTHDAVIQLLLCHFLQLPLDTYRGLVQHTATLNELHWDAGEWTVRQINSNWHILEDR